MSVKTIKREALIILEQKRTSLIVPDQNGISQTCYVVEIHHSGPVCTTR